MLLQTNYGSDQGVLSSREEGGIDLKERVRLDISKAVQALSQVNTMYKFQNKLYKNTRFVAPESVLLGSRWESSLSDGVVACNKRVPDESFYKPILKNLDCLLQNPLFAEQIIEKNFDPSPNDIYRSFKDGLTFKSQPLFSVSFFRQTLFSDKKYLYVFKLCMTGWGLQTHCVGISATIV